MKRDDHQIANLASEATRFFFYSPKECREGGGMLERKETISYFNFSTDFNFISGLNRMLEFFCSTFSIIASRTSLTRLMIMRLMTWMNVLIKGQFHGIKCAYWNIHHVTEAYHNCLVIFIIYRMYYISF